MADNVDMFERAARKEDSEFDFVGRFFSYCSINCLLPLGSILWMNALHPLVPIRHALSWIEAIYAVPFLGQMPGVSSLYPPVPPPRVRQPLRFRKVALAPPQSFFRPLAVLDVKGGRIPFDYFSGFVIE